jgi:glutamate formiminotransferase/formiminotetrahydrofolate cyclodeaminase
MPTPLVECIANFSDARRPEVIEAIMKAIRSVPSISLLDRHSDLDHNRTVLTFIGPPDRIGEAAFQAIACAAELIDLNQHIGEHPRIGASDVVPFVPISGVTMQDCIEIANQVGKRVGEELQIPVYLYEEAAARPDRKNLEDIRRGEYEGLKDEIEVKPERAPDYGPPRLGPAGATVIGARQPLIAFNVYLTSADVSIANQIAKAVRHSSGGLRYVKGLGLLVEGRAQVSMNLTNFRRTPVARVVETIRREAARYGVAIDHSELVGLIPQEALVEAARWYLQLDQFEPEQILEQRLAQALAEEHEPDFLDALADATPTPGGGSAAAYSGAAAAGLVEMVARLTIGKKKYAQVEAQMLAVLEEAERLRADLTEAIREDAAAFEAVMAAFRLPKDTSDQQDQRSAAVERAMLAAAQAPLRVAHKAVRILELAEQVVRMGNLNAISDGATAAALAIAALTGSGYNVRINAIELKDQAAAKDMLDQIAVLDRRADGLELNVRQLLADRGGMPLA